MATPLDLTLTEDLFQHTQLLVPFSGLFIRVLTLTERLCLHENENEGVS